MTERDASARWAEVRRAVEEALLLPPEERLGYLDRCVADAALLAEAKQLLAFDRQASTMFSLKGWHDRSGAAEQPMTGTLLGSYRVLYEIGRGGMGAVYLAERADGAYQQQVAVKLLQESLGTPQMQARFFAERQMLARLTHPGVVRLLDGGVTDGGRPFLVLEYVNGIAIDRYCEQRALDLQAILRLFLKVADAIQAAHQQLVLHLDLKPANILISEDGEPHLLDFGIARLLGEGGTTQPSLLLMTPRYASPEQAEGKPLGVASDVFSLATLLYRLLTGVLPYPIEDATPLEAARMIREVPPLPPSAVTADTQAATLRGDLDLILLQALRKEPERRYPTVAAFADDVRNYLQARPVAAHRDSVRYRARKFFKRNAVAVAAAAAVLVGAAVSVALVVRSAREARRQQAIAQRRLMDVRGIAHSYIFDIDGKLQAIPGALEVRHTVLVNARKYLEAMSAEVGDDEGLMRELAAGYAQIGRAEANPGFPSLRDWKSAEASRQKGVEIARELLRRHPDSASDRMKLVAHLMGESQTFELEGDLRQRARLDREAWEVAQPLLDQPPSSVLYLTLAVTPLMIGRESIGDDDWTVADPAAGLPWIERADEMLNRYEKVMPAGRTDVTLNQVRSVVQYFRASVARQMGDVGEAKRHFQLGLARPLPSSDGVSEDSVQRSVKVHYAWLLMDTGDVDGAEAVAPRMAGAMGHEPANDVLGLLAGANEEMLLGQIAVRRGRTVEGSRTIDRAMGTLERLHRETPEDAIQAANLAVECLRLGKDTALLRGRRLGWLREAAALAESAWKRNPEALRAALVAADAEGEWEKLERGQGHGAVARMWLGRVLAVREDQVEARRMLRALS